VETQCSLFPPLTNHEQVGLGVEAEVLFKMAAGH